MLNIKKLDYPIFLEYCKKLGLNINSNKRVFYNVEVLDSFECIKKKNLFVEPLNETIDFMQANIYNFEHALELIKEMYNKKLNIKYKEVNYL